MSRQDYDETYARYPTKYSVVSHDRERQAVLENIPTDDKISGRFFAANVARGQGGQTLFDGAIVLTASENLWIVSAKGSFRPKVECHPFPYVGLQNRVASGEAHQFGGASHVASFSSLDGEGYLLTFWEEERRDQFCQELKQHLFRWHEARQH